MSVIKGIHHLELKSKSLISICDYFIQAFGFQALGNCNNRCILKSGSATFVAEQLSNNGLSEIDTVYDIALEVDNVESLVDKAINYNVEILSYPKNVKNLYGSITIAQIQSCVGNIVHTLICRHNYDGAFLPHSNIFESMPDNSSFVKGFDHITLAVPSGRSDSIIQWYQDLFGMARIKINSDDSVTEGFVVHHKEGGMRLKAFDYWKCSEFGINNKEESCKFVIAEELNDKVPNQIGTFLREHGGPGVQHVGLLVTDMAAAARICQDNGAKFMSPPKEYYDLIEGRLATIGLGMSQAELQKYGVLVDCEVGSGDGPRYLMQAFSRPIFDRDTFFLELIERRGATGFGSGNIKALWDAVDLSLAELGLNSPPGSGLPAS